MVTTDNSRKCFKWTSHVRFVMFILAWRHLLSCHTVSRFWVTQHRFVVNANCGLLLADSNHNAVCRTIHGVHRSPVGGPIAKVQHTDDVLRPHSEFRSEPHWTCIGNLDVSRYHWLQHFHYCVQIQLLDQTGTKNLRSFRHSVATYFRYSPRIIWHFYAVAWMNFGLTSLWNLSLFCVTNRQGWWQHKHSNRKWKHDETVPCLDCVVL